MCVSCPTGQRLDVTLPIPRCVVSCSESGAVEGTGENERLCVAANIGDGNISESLNEIFPQWAIALIIIGSIVAVATIIVIVLACTSFIGGSKSATALIYN